MSENNQGQEQKQPGKPWLRYLTVLMIVGATSVIWGFYWLFMTPNSPNEGREGILIKIRSGMNFNEIATQLRNNQVISDINSFKLAANISRSIQKIQAGKYEFSTGLTNWEVLKRLTNGKIHLEKITVPEGKTCHFIASLLKNKIEIDSTKFINLVFDSSFTQSLGIDAPALEGFLYPDTYYFTWGMSEKQCIKAMVELFKQKFPAEIRDQDVKLALTRYQLVILASLIEGEVQIDSERPLVSALYRNRLKNGMLLQSCPTVQYIIPDGPRRLLNKDLEIDSPYNTYIYPGLPPGPINNPGVESLLAAAYPEDVPYLYMVARGDGGHNFSRSFSGHVIAKQQFDNYRRQVNREKRQKR
ncbi:endolytic transglycosylase MltG [candidate division KSB1 bacterium]|nr:endolytic transglycosylase MltG [candidate division KSB1 bacterium]